MLHSFILIILSYLFGSIPSGYVLCLVFKGIDIRKHGSGNIGATNVKRVAGKFLGLLTFLIDGTKGIIPTLFARNVLLTGDKVTALVGLVGVIGHIFPIYFKCKPSGKGVATTIFTYFVLSPLMGLFLLCFWIFVFNLKGYSSLSSLISITITTVLTFIVDSLLHYDLPYHNTYITLFTLPTLMIIITRHADNIKRLINGTEHSFKNKHAVPSDY